MLMVEGSLTTSVTFDARNGAKPVAVASSR